MLVNITGPLRLSKIDGQPIFGLRIADTKLLGVKGAKIGIYDFPFQSLAKFKSPASILEKYQPWIN